MRKALRITAYFLCGILLLAVGAVVYLNSPWGQDLVRGKAEAYLRNKLKTEVRIGHLGYGLPKYVVVEDALFLDQARDTLLSVKTLKVDLNMIKLLHKKIDIQQVVLKGVHSHIYRNAPDTSYNFSYIINAFSGNAPATPKTNDTAASPLTFNLDKVVLDDIHARFDDQSGGIQLAVNLDHLALKTKEVDFDKMLFHIKDFSVSGLQTVFNQDTSYLPPTPKDTTKSMVKIIADNVAMEQVAFKYNNRLNKFLFALQLGTLQLKLNEYNRDNNRVDIEKLAINNSSGNLMIGKSTTPPAPIDTIVKIDTTEGWDVSAKDIDVWGINFKMDNENEPKLLSGFDYNHLDIHGMAMKLQDLVYADEVSGKLKHFTVTDQSGLDVRELKTAFNYNSEGVILKDLFLQTPNTTLQNYIEVHYPSLVAANKQPGAIQLKINIEHSIVGMHDAILFMPYLKKQDFFRRYSNGRIRLDASVMGSVNNLDIAKLYAQGLGNTEISASGRLRGLPEPNAIRYDLRIAKFNSSRNDIVAIVPASALPTQVRIPDRFGAVGQLSGNLNDYYTDIVFASTDGLAYVKGMFLTSPGKNKEEYDLFIKTMQLNVGHILEQDSLVGEVTATINVKGKSLDVKTMSADADAKIAYAYIKGYRYHDITMTGKAADQHVDADIVADDANLQVQLKGQADFKGKYPAAIVDINVDSIDLHALKLSKTELRAMGRIHADFPDLNPDYPQGSFTWKQLVVVTEGKRYFMDSIYAISRPSADTGQNIIVNLGVVDAHITGKIPLTKIGAVVQGHIDRHYQSVVNDSLRINIANLTNKKSKDRVNASIQKQVAVPGQSKTDTITIPDDYNLELTAHIYDKPMFHSLYPGLSSFDSIHVDGSLSPHFLTLNVSAPEIVYKPYTIENSNIQLRGSDSALTYKVTLDKLSWSNFALYYADAHGKLDNNIITASVSLSDVGKTERFAFNANMESKGDSQIIRLDPGLKLNYEVWQVNEPNRIVLAKNGFYVRNFGISNNGQAINANNAQPIPNTPLKVDINNFKLANLTDIASKNDTLPANGILSGNVTIEQMTANTKITGDLQIQNLSVYGDTMGNMHAIVDNKTDDRLNTNITLVGNGNDIALTGIYYLQPADNNMLDMNLAINALSIHTFEGLSMGQIKNSSGYLRGTLKVKGTIADPDITGELRTDNLETTVAVLNTPFKMPAERITFSDKQIEFNNFTILDNAGNKAQVKGTMDITNLSDPGYNLSLRANNWHAVHSTAKENKDLYGDLILSMNVTATGTVTTPSFDGNVHVLKGTKLTVTNPTEDPALQSSKGIVVFVNMRDSSFRKRLVVRRADTVKKHKISPGAGFNVNVTVDKNAEFSLVIDEASGDFINMRGEAYLNAAVTPGGVFAVTGTYLLHEGVYQMNYNFIRRRFIIQDGSTITFEGDPLKNTIIDVSAIYHANTPPYDLVMRQVPDPAQLVYFKQSLPFNIDLHLTGNVIQPAISFNIELPENKVYPLAADQIELIQAKLNQIRQDTSELNKQVFAALILGRFVSDDPFSAGAAQGVGMAAMQSVSTFIGEQLNQVAGNLIKGVDLTADLATKDDYTTGEMRERTDLSLAASKRLLNDRLKLTLGNDFEVEGPQTNNDQGTTLPSNLAADYIISRDGRYSTQVYRRNYDEGVLQGYVTETGLNFIVNVDYNRFKTVFKRAPKRRKMTPAADDTSKVVNGPIK